MLLTHFNSIFLKFEFNSFDCLVLDYIKEDILIDDQNLHKVKRLDRTNLGAHI